MWMRPSRSLIDKGKDKETLLLLDAFDEDPEAGGCLTVSE